jgi:hypothetical protein
MCNSLQGFRKIRQPNKGEHGLRVGNGAYVWGQVVGDLELLFDCNRIVLLKDILYAPNFKHNLISIAKRTNHGYFVSFHSSITISRNRDVLGTCMVIYYL